MLPHVLCYECYLPILHPLYPVGLAALTGLRVPTPVSRIPYTVLLFLNAYMCPYATTFQYLPIIMSTRVVSI